MIKTKVVKELEGCVIIVSAPDKCPGVAQVAW